MRVAFVSSAWFRPANARNSSLSAVLLHSGETLLLAQDFDPAARGCRLDLARLQNAGMRIADALSHGADLVIINRFGKRERDGKGLSHLIGRALDADIPVVIAVGRDHFADWIKFAGGMSVRLGCERDALEAWWHGITAEMRSPATDRIRRFARFSNRPLRATGSSFNAEITCSPCAVNR